MGCWASRIRPRCSWDRPARSGAHFSPDLARHGGQLRLRARSRTAGGTARLTQGSVRSVGLTRRLRHAKALEEPDAAFLNDAAGDSVYVRGLRICGFEGRGRPRGCPVPARPGQRSAHRLNGALGAGSFQVAGQCHGELSVLGHATDTDPLLVELVPVALDPEDLV